MDMIKVVKFIAQKRKEKNLTQNDLASKLNITDRAISKWECGRSMPDSSVMLKLCELLGISVNELLTGDELGMSNYNKQAELNLIEMKRQKEESDKRFLTSEIVMLICSLLVMFALIFIAKYVDMKNWLRILLIISGFLIILVIGLYALRIEQIAGYYECSSCNNKFIPKYGQVLFSPHLGRDRYMKCPHCGRKEYHKKAISK